MHRQSRIYASRHGPHDMMATAVGGHSDTSKLQQAGLGDDSMLSFISAALESLLEDVDIDYPVVTRRWSFAIAGKQANDTMPLHQAFEIWAWPESASKDALLPFHRKPGAGHLTRFWKLVADGPTAVLAPADRVHASGTTVHAALWRMYGADEGSTGFVPELEKARAGVEGKKAAFRWFWFDRRKAPGAAGVLAPLTELQMRHELTAVFPENIELVGGEPGRSLYPLVDDCLVAVFFERKPSHIP
ncbi:uncharacterized protein RHOBADRAFT_51268 [Rhodotorula graminis WP1]|uniref:Uncharacterized protein n=1 Tax=Rhodotorula graminis (strain WP1) TaxID=578459 RepID=A0A194S9X9_RHOGW|nr:uncharacterized protein RHOBADRAFT_51268 [Rhodotorula graminis WP1]KPV77412.1 hypothetical protein RHOBADRAFT_51268 [Rhodotorula graminis WP1]